MIPQPCRSAGRFSARLVPLFLVLVAGWAACRIAPAAQPNRFRGQAVANKPVAPPAPPSALLTAEAWQQAPWTPLEPGEIDRLVAKELQASHRTPAPRTTDEQFIRRATLDLTGELPTPAQVSAFVADADSHKRSGLIDRLLDSDAYATHWAHYWRDVVMARLADRRGLALARPFEVWLHDQFRRNTGWGEIARTIIAADGTYRFDGAGQGSPAFFLAAHRGKEADSERAAETSRVFLGIQIQCAQCHDHPFDQWKRVQFHELAGYFARLRERPVREGKKVVGFAFVSAFRGEHEMPNKADPKKALITPPRFLDGTSPGNNLGDRQRRQALARSITDKKNYWFAAAYVNRMWGVLMGQAFYEPVDDLGPGREAIFPSVLTRLTGAFRGSNYDVKQLFRDVMNSETYQRQMRPSEGTGHLHFAATYPTRLPADALWHSLVNVLGGFGPPAGQAQRLAQARPKKPQAQGKGLPRPQQMQNAFEQEFAFDPSVRAEDVEGSISQALLLMNGPGLNQRMQARGPTMLARLLADHPDDGDAVEHLYLRALARKPTARELDKCRAYIDKVGNRAEAFEDLLWVLLNSTEFQTKR
jgi:hypothetical protein